MAKSVYSVYMKCINKSSAIFLCNSFFSVKFKTPDLIDSAVF